MYNAGEYDGSDEVAKMLEYCKQNVWPGGGGVNSSGSGHWHYMHYYFAQVMYRDEKQWPKYSKEVIEKILSTQAPDGSWQEGHVGSVYVTAINATILQLDKACLPIFQR